MHKTATGERIKELKKEARKLRVEAGKLRDVRGMEPGAKERETEALVLDANVENLKPRVRLDDLSVYQVEKVKSTAKGEKKTYVYWYASWWEGSRARNVYLGSTRKLSEEAALVKARKMKAVALGLDQ